MASNPIKRVRYYERQFLGTRDFQVEQAYHIAMRRRHLIAHHTWSIVAGLDIVEDKNSKVWSVQPGMAVDGYGREIVVWTPQPLDMVTIADRLRDASLPTKLKVWIAYHVEQADRPSPGYEVCDGKDQFMRVRETFRIIYDDSPNFGGRDPKKQEEWPRASEELPDDSIEAPWPVYLGTITWDTDPANSSQKTITTVDSVDPRDSQSRRYVGLVGAEIFSPTPAQTLDVHAKKTVCDQDVVIRGTTGDGAGRLRLDVDSQDASVITNKKAPVENEPNPPAGDIYLRTNNEAGGKKVIIDKDTLQAKAAEVSENLTVSNNITAQGKVTAGQLDVTGSVVVQGGLTVDAGTDLNIHGGQIALKEAGGGEDTDPMRIARHKRGDDHYDMRIQIGDNIGGDDRLVVGPLYYADGQFKEQFVVKNNGDVTLAGNLMVQGNIDLGGRVDGRDLAADGAKLDGISAEAKNVAVIAGEVADGGTILLPSGFTEAQCQWLVSPRIFDPPIFDINEIDASAQFRIECYTTGRTVTVKWYQRGHASSPVWASYPGTANYIVVGVR